MSVSSLRLPDAGTPLTSLKALMIDRAPASTDALNGGRKTPRSVCSLMSVVLYSTPPTAAE